MFVYWWTIWHNAAFHCIILWNKIKLKVWATDYTFLPDKYQSYIYNHLNTLLNWYSLYRVHHLATRLPTSIFSSVLHYFVTFELLVHNYNKHITIKYEEEIGFPLLFSRLILEELWLQCPQLWQQDFWFHHSTCKDRVPKSRKVNFFFPRYSINK